MELGRVQGWCVLRRARAPRLQTGSLAQGFFLFVVNENAISRIAGMLRLIFFSPNGAMFLMLKEHLKCNHLKYPIKEHPYKRCIALE